MIKHLTPLKLITSSLCLLFCLLAQHASAASAYWDINGDTPGAGGPTPSGLWEDANWTLDASGSSATTTWTDGDFPIFAAGTDASGSSFVVTVSGTHTIAGMQMLAPCTNVVINGTGTLNIAEGLQGFFPNGASLGGSGLWINVALGGTGGLINQNSSYLYLYGNNTYSGGTLFTANHIIYYNNNNSFGSGPITNTAASLSLLTTNALALAPNLPNEVWINNGGGVFNFGSGNTTLSGAWHLQSSTTLKNNGSSSSILTLSGPISSPEGVTAGLSLQCPNSGKIVLSGANTYSGQTLIGKLAGGTGNNTVSVASFNSVNGGTPLLASSSLGCPTTVAEGTIGLGDLTYPATLLYTGAGETSDRVLNLASTSAGVTLDQSGTGLLKFTSDLTSTGVGSKTLTLQGSTAGSGEVAGAIVDNPTAGSTTLAAAFTSGKTTITLASVDGLVNGAAISGTGIPAGDTVKSFNAGTKVVTLNAATTGAGALGQTITVAGVVNKTSVTKAGTGTWVLSGANTYSGDTTLSAGILQLGAENVIPHGPGYGRFLLNGGTLELAGFNCSINGGGGAGNIDNNSGTVTLTMDNNNVNTSSTFSGVIRDTAPGVLNLVANGGGTLALTSTGNPYSGNTTVNNAVLQITAENQLGNTPGSLLANNIVLDSNLGYNALGGTNVNNYYLRLQSTAVVDLSANRGIYLGNNLGYGGGLGAQSGKTLNVRGPISGPGGLWLGGGTQNAAVGNVALFNTGNTYAGGTFITGGTLTLGDHNVLPVGTPLTMADVAAACNFDMNGKNQTIGPLTGFVYPSGTPQLKLSGALTILQTANTTFGGVISQSGGSLTLDATSTGTLTLVNNNTYTGPTLVNGGKLQIGVGGSLASPVTVAGGAALQLDSTTALTPAANLILKAGASVDLNFSGTSTIHYLSLDGGLSYVTPGTYGPVGSAATFTDARLTSSTGNGILSVLGAPTIEVLSLANPSTYGDSVTFTATVTGSAATPTGTVTFQDGAATLGTATLDGTGQATFATSGLSAATHSITAAYGGDSNYGAGTSAAVSQVVNAAASSTALLSSENPSTNGDSVTFTATVTGPGTPTGDVVFLTNGVTMATVALSGGSASVSTALLPVGATAVQAQYAAQANWLASSSPLLSQVVQSAVTLSTTNTILSIVSNHDGSFTLNCLGTPGAQYYIATSPELATAMSSWTALADSTNTASSPSGVWSFAVSNAAPAFYRSIAITPAP